MKKFLLNCLFSLFVLGLCLGGIEIFLRTTHVFGARLSWSNPDSVLGWRFVPGKRFWFSEENPKPILWNTNSFGWKDREWAKDKAPDSFRIAVLGDSYVEALQVEPEKNFVSLSQSLLPELRGKKIEWMNFGRSGFGQAEELLVLKNDLERIQPDLVIVFFFPVNDIDDVNPKTSPDPVRPFFIPQNDGGLRLDTSFKNSRSYQLKSAISRLKQNSALISLLSQRYSLLQQQKKMGLIKRESESRTSSPLRGYLSLATSRPDPVYMENYKLNKRLITEMASYVESNGIELMLVNIDTPAYLPKIEEKFGSKDPSFDPLFFEKDLQKLSEELGIRYLSLQSFFREDYLKNNQLLHWPYWEHGGRGAYWEYGAHTGHWNYEGHQKVAEILTESLKNQS